MRYKQTFIKLTLLILLMPGLPVQASECVILLHGLARSSSSMNKLEDSLLESGFKVANFDYPSRKFTIEDLAGPAVEKGLEACAEYKPEKIHFVTHSLGGILVRQYLNESTIENLGRVVMLGPPNGGSEVVDEMANVPGFKFINGPAGLQLGTGDESIPKSLGAANFDVGIIAGTKSINLILSLFIPSVDDGKVSLESAHLENEADFMDVEVSHPFLMKDDEVIENVLEFLKTGSFTETKK